MCFILSGGSSLCLNFDKVCVSTPLVAPLIGGSGKSNHCQYDQLAKKVVSDSLGLVDFAIGLVNSVLNLPDGQ